MIGRKIDMILGLIGLGTLIYAFFHVQLGGRTMYEHTRRIAATEPAQELQQDVRETSRTVQQRVVNEVETIASERLQRIEGIEPLRDAGRARTH